MKKKLRADLYLVENNYFETRSKAEIAIREGRVKINGEFIHKPGTPINLEKNNEVVVTKEDKYVSRGGYKLEKALREFNLNVENKICLDIGSSTGGFTDCLLKNNAKKVYAVDVGYGQLDSKLRNNPKVIVYERTNIRNINDSFFDEKIDVVVVDVSFISITKFLHNIIKFLNDDFIIIVLVKPQFESDRGDTVKGIVKDKKIFLKVLLRIKEYLEKNNLYLNNITVSPIKGAKGNIEFLIKVTKNSNSVSDREIEQLI